MVEVTIGGTDYVLQRYSLKRLRRVAPEIDRLRALNREMLAKLEAASTPEARAELLGELTLASSLDQLADYLRVVAAGIPDKTPSDAELTAQADGLEDAISMEEARGLNATFLAILQEAGLAAKPGESQPGSMSEPQGQSPGP